MKDFTKFVCDLISFGSQLSNSATAEQKMQCLAGIILREDIASLGDVDLEAVADHIESSRSAMRGADHDIDNRQPVSIKRITEFHNKLSVHLSDGRELQFNYHDIVHY